MKDNKGMSLVELLITVTILAFVIIGASTFMLTGSRSFAKGSADSNVQKEAELAVNQIEDLVIDVNGGVYYDDSSEPNKESLVMYHVEPDTSGFSVFKKRKVTWDKSKNNVYSSEWTVDKDPSSGVYVETGTVYANELLAENVMDFNVDLSDIIKETDKDGNDIDIVRSVVIKVGCKDGTGKAAYATTPVITLRNRLMLSGSPDAIFPTIPTPDDKLLLYISDVGMAAAVPVKDRVTTVERGKMYNIYVMVNAGTNVNSLCNFTVEGETSGTNSTIPSSGVHIVLDVNASEPNDYLKITASYITNPSKTVSGWVKVIGGDGKSLDSVTIIPENLKPYTAEFDAEALTTNFSPEEKALIEYKWSVSEPDRFESFVTTNKQLKLNVIKNEENYNKVVTITVVAYSPTTNQSVSDTFTYRIEPPSTTSGDSLMERGKEGYEEGFHGDNWYGFKLPKREGKDEYGNDKNVCEIVTPQYGLYVCDINGNEISAKNYLTSYVIINVNKKVTSPLYGGQDVGYWLTLDKSLPADEEFYLKVIIYFKYSDGTEWNYERIHYVSAVHLFGETTKSTITNNGVFNDNSAFAFYYTLTGYYSNTWATEKPDVFEYEINYEYDAPEGVTVEPDLNKWGGWTTNVDGGKRIKGSAAFKVTNNSGKEWYQVQPEIKMKRAVIKISMKAYPNVYTYAYVDFE